MPRGIRKGTQVIKLEFTELTRSELLEAALAGLQAAKKALEGKIQALTIAARPVVEVDTQLRGGDTREAFDAETSGSEGYLKSNRRFLVKRRPYSNKLERVPVVGKPRRKMSAAGKKAIREAQAKRWAEWKKAHKKVAASKSKVVKAVVAAA